MAADVIPTTSLVGTTLARKYRLDAVLGTGGMATVYAATHRNGARFAIKVLHPRLAADDGVRRRFLREGYAANRVGHPAALRVVDDDVTPEGVVFLVLDLLDGETVARRAERAGGRLTVAEVLSIAHGALDVLAAAHQRGIVHRDVKPDNLFVKQDGGVTVLDFGIARLRDAAAVHAQTSGQRAMGTPAFMPPEQARGRPRELDGRADLWALGATMFRLLTGRFVHPGATPLEIATYAATKPAPRLASVAPDVPLELGELVDRALSFDRDRRWPNAEAMREAVGDIHVALFGRDVGLLPGAQSIPAVGGRRAADDRDSTPLAPLAPRSQLDSRATIDALPAATIAASAAQPEGRRLLAAGKLAMAALAVLAVSSSGSIAPPSRRHGATTTASGGDPDATAAGAEARRLDTPGADAPKVRPEATPRPPAAAIAGGTAERGTAERRTRRARPPALPPATPRAAPASQRRPRAATAREQVCSP